MASIYDIAGTINNSFTIGDNGITIFHGTSLPTLDIGKLGDIYVLDNCVYEIEIPLIDENGEPILDENGEPDTTKELTSRPLGRIYYRCIIDGVECWERIKNYSFDGIVNAQETYDFSDNYKVSIKKASQPGVEPTEEAINDFDENNSENNRGSYGVVRFSTDNEATSGERVDTVINPKQLIDNIVHLIAEHNTDNDEGDDPRHPYIQKRIDDEITRAKTAEGVLQKNINTEALTRETADKNLQTQIDAINARKDVVDVVGTIEELEAYDTTSLTELDIVKVLSDSAHSDRQSYYRWVEGSWVYIGSDAASYTKAEIDDKVDVLNASIDLKANITDVNNEIEILNTRIDSEVSTLNTRIDNEVSTLNDSIDLKADASKVYTKDEIIELLDDASADVDELLTHKQDKITITELDKDKVLSNDGTNLTWREIADITELKGMYDVAIENPVDGQTLVYDEEKKKWVNGLQKTATIKYW